MRAKGFSLRAAAAACLAAACSLFFLPGAGCEPPAADDPVVLAARTRQESVKSLVVEFTETDVLGQGRSSPPLILRSENRLAIEGDKVRFESNNPQWLDRIEMDEKSPPVSFLLVLNDGCLKRYYPAGLAANHDPLIMINDQHTQGYLLSAVLAPLMATFRGLSPAHSLWPVDRLKVTGETGKVGAADCQEYLRPITQMDAYHCWLDSGPDHLIRRVELHIGRRSIDQLDIDYERQGQHVVPRRWRWRPFPSDREEPHGFTVELTKVEFDVGPQAADHFEVPYPEGIEVRDFKKQKKYKAAADGSLILISSIPPDHPAESPLEAPWYRNKFVLVPGAVTLAALFFGYYLISKRKTRTGQPPIAPT
jgi:hypothetical protein